MVHILPGHPAGKPDQMSPIRAAVPLAFTKSAMRRIYDELTAAVVKSSMLRLVLFALAYTAGFLVLRAAIAFGLGLLNSMWMAIGVGLLLGAVFVAQDQIFAWLRTLNAKKGGKA